MTITGERVTTPAGGFNPTWQRHVAAYALCAPFLGPGTVLDLGCGIGHSYDLLAPRETRRRGHRRRARSPARIARPHVADMRALPFADASFASVLSVHSIEHVPGPRARARRGRAACSPRAASAVFVTPNRLTFARPDEIIDPYHFVEYRPRGAARPCAGRVSSAVEMHGPVRLGRAISSWSTSRARDLDRLLAGTRCACGDWCPDGLRQRLYDRMLTAGAARRRSPRRRDQASRTSSCAPRGSRTASTWSRPAGWRDGQVAEQRHQRQVIPAQTASMGAT